MKLDHIFWIVELSITDGLITPTNWYEYRLTCHRTGHLLPFIVFGARECVATCIQSSHGFTATLAVASSLVGLGEVATVGMDRGRALIGHGAHTLGEGVHLRNAHLCNWEVSCDGTR